MINSLKQKQETGLAALWISDDLLSFQRDFLVLCSFTGEEVKFKH